MKITDRLTGMEFQGDHAEFNERRIRLTNKGRTVVLIPVSRAKIRLEDHEIQQIPYQK